MSNIFRKIKRDIAKDNIRAEGKTQINKHSYSTIKSPITGMTSTTKNPSFFAENWKNYVYFKESK